MYLVNCKLCDQVTLLREALSAKAGESVLKSSYVAIALHHFPTEYDGANLQGRMCEEQLIIF